MESKFTGVYIDLLRSLQLHVICIVMTLLLLYRVGERNAFLSEFGGGGGGVMDLVYSSSFLPLHGLFCVFQ